MAIWAPSVAEWIVVEFAVAKAGLTLVTVNPTYKAEELRYVLHDSAAEVLFNPVDTTHYRRCWRSYHRWHCRRHYHRHWY